MTSRDFILQNIAAKGCGVKVWRSIPRASGVRSGAIRTMIHQAGSQPAQSCVDSSRYIYFAKLLRNRLVVYYVSFVDST
jgi:hypothetical protein